MTAGLTRSADDLVDSIDRSRAAVSTSEASVHAAVVFFGALNRLNTTGGDIADKDMPALKTTNSYDTLNTHVLPYHANVHNAAGGHMPDADTSPSDPIFWPFHALLVSIYERWRLL